MSRLVVAIMRVEVITVHYFQRFLYISCIDHSCREVSISGGHEVMILGVVKELVYSVAEPPAVVKLYIVPRTLQARQAHGMASVFQLRRLIQSHGKQKRTREEWRTGRQVMWSG